MLLLKKGNIVKYEKKFGIVTKVCTNSAKVMTEARVIFLDEIEKGVEFGVYDTVFNLVTGLEKLIFVLEGREELAEQARNNNLLADSVIRYSKGDKTVSILRQLCSYIGLYYNDEKEIDAGIYDNLIELIIRYKDIELVCLYIDKYFSLENNVNELKQKCAELLDYSKNILL